MKRKAFSLLELLTVLAILTILASLLFPVMQAAVKQARVTRSSNTMRQVALALNLYCNDYEPPSPFSICTPPSLSTLLQTKQLTVEQLTSTIGDKGAYTSVFPTLPVTDEATAEIWKKHIEATSGNPIFALDLSDNDVVHNPDANHWSKIVALGVRLDGSVKLRRGSATALSDSLTWIETDKSHEN